MKGKWGISSQYIGDHVEYIVYRLRDVNGVDHSGNREFGSGYMADREEAARIADELNRSEL